jgi:hypothetical protein
MIFQHENPNSRKMERSREIGRTLHLHFMAKIVPTGWGEGRGAVQPKRPFLDENGYRLGTLLHKIRNLVRMSKKIFSAAFSAVVYIYNFESQNQLKAGN